MVMPFDTQPLLQRSSDTNVGASTSGWHRQLSQFSGHGTRSWPDTLWKSVYQILKVDWNNYLSLNPDLLTLTHHLCRKGCIVSYLDVRTVSAEVLEFGLITIRGLFVKFKFPVVQLFTVVFICRGGLVVNVRFLLFTSEKTCPNVLFSVRPVLVRFCSNGREENTLKTSCRWAPGRGFNSWLSGRFSNGDVKRQRPCVESSANVEDPQAV